MGKKKFIDKRKSATFQLLARDSSDPVYSEGLQNDRVFVRVDNNPVSINGLNEDDEGLDGPDSIFADAPDDDDDYVNLRGGSVPLPDHVRKEILELGFPDDGYNYLLHLREIRNTGGGSAYYHNPKTEFRNIPHDVKAYDASKLRIHEADEDTNPKTLYKVAEKSVNVRVQKAVDPEVVKLLEENESETGSDLEEDFVVQANLVDEVEDVNSDEILTSANEHQEEIHDEYDTVISHEMKTDVARTSKVEVAKDQSVCEKPRVDRLLDHQFDLLESQEYGTESDDDYYDGITAVEDTMLAERLYVLKSHELDDLDLDGNYKAPADILHDKDKTENEKIVGSAAELIRRCVEYGEKYENEDGNDREVVIVEESSDESEAWDCETIVSTYSNLDNHPGRIGAPGGTRKKKLYENIEVLKSGSGNMISLGGKEKLPVDYLPRSKKVVSKEKVEVKMEQPKRKPRDQESKVEKKERKAVVKEEKREARRLKKEMKGLYLNEAKLAQKVAAVTGPSSIHLM